MSGGLLALGAMQPMVEISGPDLSVALGKRLELGLDPSAGGELDETLRGLLLVAAAATGVWGLLLLVTRVRYLGLVWRLLALATLLGPALLAYGYWRFVSDPTEYLRSDDPTFGEQVAGGAADLLQSLGLLEVTPGSGLLLTGGAVALGFLACLVPAFRSSVAVNSPAPPSAASASPGWYVSQDDPRFIQYWDGQSWSARQLRQ